MTGARSPGGIRPFQVAAGILIAVKLAIMAFTPPIGDEAYYWLWGQHLAPSYYDHPPLNAWLLRLSNAIFGWNLWALRFPALVAFAVTVGLFWLWSVRLSPRDSQRLFWRILVVYLASPLFMAMTSIAFPDYLLVALTAGTAFTFLEFTDRFERCQPATGLLYLSAILAGLAVLTKYNAIFLPLGLAAMVLLKPGLRPLLKTIHPWLAGLVSVAIQAPVLYWNATEGFASYRYHLTERGEAVGLMHPTWTNASDFIAFMLAGLSPVLMIALWRLFTRRPASTYEAGHLVLARAVFVLSTGVLIALSLYVYAYFYWNIVAYVAAMPLLARYLGERMLFWLHAAYGVLVALLLAFNITVMPIQNLWGGGGGEAAQIFGWPRIAEAVTQARQRFPGAFLAGTRYTIAAQLGFALGATDVTALDPRQDQFDYWRDDNAIRGRNAIIVAADSAADSYLRQVFVTVTPLSSVEVKRFGKSVSTYYLYFGQSFEPNKAVE